MTDSVEGNPSPRGALRLIVDPTFGALFWGKILAVVAVWTHSLVAAVVVHEATHSALMVGLVGVAQFAPQLVLTLISGKWADKGNPVRQIYLGRLLCATGSGVVAVLLTVIPTAQSGHTTVAVLAGSLVVGIGFVVGGPAMQSIVPSLIRAGELPTAMALNSVPMTLGRIAGPALGAVLIAQFDPSIAFGVSAAMSLVFVVLMLIARFPTRQKPKAGGDDRVRAALHFIRHDRPLLLALVAVAAVGFASDTSITLAPSVADYVGGDTRLIGLLSASFGAGAAFGLVFMAAQRGRVGSPRASQAGLLFLCFGNTVLAVAAVPKVALVGFALAGLGFGLAMSSLSTIVQERAPDDLRGRIMAVWLIGFVGSRPLAAAILGGAADLWSVHVSFTISAGVVLAAAIWCRPKKLAQSP